MSRVLVTGGAGFIGSHLVAGLLRQGHQVAVLDDLSSGRQENLEEVRRELPEARQRLRFVEGSLLDEDALRQAIEGAEVVFHQAAIPSVPRSFSDPAATLRANVEGTARVLEAARTGGVQRLVFASSSSVYGDNETLPKHEDLDPAPRSPYAVSKLAGERLLDVYAREHGLPCAALRYFNVFGPRQDPDSQYAAVVPKFISSMLDGEPPVVFGDGEQSRDFTYVDNVVAANLVAAGMAENAAGPVAAGDAGARQAGVMIINVGVGSRFTLLDLVAGINRILGTSLRPRFDAPRAGDVRHSQAAIEKARTIGYRPAVDFAEGLRRTVAWFEGSPDAPLQDLQAARSKGSSTRI